MRFRNEFLRFTIKLQLIVRHFICTNMIYYTKCRLINELSELNRFQFDFSIQKVFEFWSLVDFWTNCENQLLLRKKERKISSRVFYSFLFAFLIVVK